jgi:hypothetical protein
MDLAITDQAKKHCGPSKEWTEREIEEELKKFDQKIEEAKEQAGEVDVRDAILDKAIFLKDEARDYPEAERVFRDAYAKIRRRIKENGDSL